MAGKAAQTADARASVESARRGFLECAQHAGVAARWKCRQCNTLLCAECPTLKYFRDVPMRICSACQTMGRLSEVSDEEQDPGLFWRHCRAAVSYPFMGFGPYLFLGAIPLATVLYFTQDLMLADVFYGFMVVGFLVAYMMEVLASTCRGEPIPPDWPDVTLFVDNVIMPIGWFLFASIVTLGPGCLLLYDASLIQGVLGMLCLLVGLYFWPMAMVAVLLHQGFLVLDPRFLWRAIRKVPNAYAFAYLSCSLLLCLQSALVMYLPTFGYFIYVLAVALLVYLLIVQMRIMGSLYYAHRKQLDWFAD